MADLYPNATYPNLTGLKSLSGSFPLGRQPGRFKVTSADVTCNPDPVGTLTITDGVRTAVLPGCAVTDPRISESGRYIEFTILDRRWKWDYTSIDGQWNKRAANDAILWEQTPQQLAALCLDAMGEGSYDVSALPNSERPHVNWVAANAADALHALVGSLGCEIGFNLSGNVKICRLGVGSPLSPSGLEKTVDVGIDNEALPDSLRVNGGPVQFEVLFDLEAVGEEPDGNIVPIDDLSYKPPDGWKNSSTRFLDVEGTYEQDGETKKLRDLARKGIWRMYRIARIVAPEANEEDSGESFNPPGWSLTGAPDVPSIEAFLPLKNRLNATYVDSQGRERPQPAQVTGQWYDGDPCGNNTSNGALYMHPWRLDEARGLVFFQEPASLIGDETFPPEERHRRWPARMRLRCVCEVDWPGLQVKVYYALSRSTGRSHGTGPAMQNEAGQFLRITPVYKQEDGQTVVDSIDDNQSDVDARLNLRLDAMEAEFAPWPQGTITRSGIHIVELDGVRREISWSLSSDSPCRTTIGLNTRVNPWLPDERKSRAASKTKLITERSERAQQAQAAAEFDSTERSRTDY